MISARVLFRFFYTKCIVFDKDSCLQQAIKDKQALPIQNGTTKKDVKSPLQNAICEHLTEFII